MNDFNMAGYLRALGAQGRVTPGEGRPLVVHADELDEIPGGSVDNPSKLALVGKLPTATFEIFRQEIPPLSSSDMHRHHHETVHVVLSGTGHSVIEEETVTWATGDFVYTPPWTWHRHWNDSADEPAHLLGIENSRLLEVLGLNRRQSAGLVGVDEARARYAADES